MENIYMLECGFFIELQFLLKQTGSDIPIIVIGILPSI